MFTGFSDIRIKASLNSINLEVRGNRQVAFKDGTVIRFSNTQDVISNTVIGTCYHNQYADLEFKDEKNGLVGYLNLGKVKGKVPDYFEGNIRDVEGKIIVEKIFGTY